MRQIYPKAVFAILFLSLAIVAPSVFAAEPTDTELFVGYGGETHVLRLVQRDAEEEFQLYEATGDPGTYFKSSRYDAELSLNGRVCPRYTLMRDTKDEDEIIFTADGVNYAMRRVVAASGAKYEVPGDPDTYFWSRGASADLFINGKRYEGYDEWLPSGGIAVTGEGIPTGIEWSVKSIAGVAVAGGSTVTATFHPDGSLSGMASVNNYRYSWLVSGNRLVVSEGVVTRMMGPEDLMCQESAFLDALARVTRFRFGGDGLILTTREGSEILLSRTE
jgi:heat shock protein HslJ